MINFKILKCVFVISILLPLSGLAQNKIDVKSERNEDNSITYSYEKRMPGNYLVYLQIQQVGNTIPPSDRITISGYSGTLFTLKPISDKAGIAFRFRYGYLRGKYKPKPDFDFVYTLPFKNGKEVKVDEITTVSASAGVSEPNNWKAFQFTTSSASDSVFVARKGMIVEVVENKDPDYNMEYSFKQEANYVIIEHKDGTLARYDVLEKNSVAPEEGDMVYPGDFLGMAGTYDKKENKQLRFRVYYLNKLEDEMLWGSRKMSDGNSFYSHLNPVFMTKEGATRLKKGDFTTAMINDELITEEMTKREKRKRLK